MNTGVNSRGVGLREVKQKITSQRHRHKVTQEVKLTAA